MLAVTREDHLTSALLNCPVHQRGEDTIAFIAATADLPLAGREEGYLPGLGASVVA